MKFSYALVTAAIAAATPARAIYAPIPEPEQGKDWLVTVRAGYTYDTNIFGAPAETVVPQPDGSSVTVKPISSSVWEVAPRVTYNHSISDQTFFSASYGLVVDEIEKRPGQKMLPSHDLTVRLAHAFTQSSSIDISDSLSIARNPESLLPVSGVPVNTDQSLTHNQIDGRYVAALTPKIGVELKARSSNFSYRNGSLSRLLDRLENLYGVAGNYAVLPEVKAVAEARHQDVYYWTQGELKNKHSNYAMGGFDYDVAKKLTLTARGGAEFRQRAQAPSTSAPFVELSGMYHYTEHSFITGGYAHTIDETSDPTRYTDQKVDRFFVNVQHAVTALIVASASFDYEPAVLQARPNLTPPASDLNETSRRMGVALTYLPTKNWSISATYDYDRVLSDETARTTERQRVGVNAAYSF